MGFSEIVSVKVERSDWEVVLAAGATFGIEQIKCKEGALRVRKTGSGSEQRLFFTGLGYSESLRPGSGFTVSITGSAADLPVKPRKAIIYRMPWGGKSLTFSELRGGFVMYEVTGNVGPLSVGGWVMFISGMLSNCVSSAGSAVVGLGALQVPFLIRTSNACIVSGGLSGVSSFSLNGSATGYVGVIF